MRMRLLLAGVGAVLSIAGAARAADPEEAPKGDSTAAPSESAEGPAAKPAAKEEKPRDWDVTDVTEEQGKKYYFIGLRYRGNIVPAFIEHLFVNEGATVFSNTIGVELDIRKDDFSLIPALSYSEYGTGDILFLEKNKDANDPANYSFINSSLKGVYATADMLWSAKLAKDVDFEYGFGVGVGVIFGDLQNNWVKQDPNGQFTASNGLRLSPCSTADTARGCNTPEHSNATVRKVGGYVEPSWFSGGSVPNFFPWISLPQLGLRFKPWKFMEGRFGVGFALTGFWFGLSANYGLEQKPDGASSTSGRKDNGPALLHF